MLQLLIPKLQAWHATPSLELACRPGILTRTTDARNKVDHAERKALNTIKQRGWNRARRIWLRSNHDVHYSRFDPWSCDASCADPKRYSRMTVPKVFINRQLYSHRGGIIRPRINYTLVYVKRGVLVYHFLVAKKSWRNLRGRGVHVRVAPSPIFHTAPQLRMVQPTF